MKLVVGTLYDATCETSGVCDMSNIDPNSDKDHGVQINAMTIYVHPDYIPHRSYLESDYCLIRTEDSMVIDGRTSIIKIPGNSFEHYLDICLKKNIKNYTKEIHIRGSVVMPVEKSNVDGDCTVYGWGRISGRSRNSSSPSLMSTEVDIYSHAKCRSLVHPYSIINKDAVRNCYLGSVSINVNTIK